MEMLERRRVLQLFLAAGALAAAGATIPSAEATPGIDGTSGIGPVDPATTEVASAEALESEMEPTQALVIRRGRRRGPRVIVRPGWRAGWRRRRRRWVCVWRRRRRVCFWRGY